MTQAMSEKTPCIKCRYWSDKIARVGYWGANPIVATTMMEAMCLNRAGAYGGQYTHDKHSCDDGEVGESIDLDEEHPRHG